MLIQLFIIYIIRFILNNIINLCVIFIHKRAKQPYKLNCLKMLKICLLFFCIDISIKKKVDIGIGMVLGT